jgi:hypothetical protein
MKAPKIGAVLGVNAEKFFVGWQDGSSYGVDIIDTETDQSEIWIQTLRYDAGSPSFQKTFTGDIGFRFSPLFTDDSVDVWYRIDNNGEFKHLRAFDGDATPGIFAGLATIAEPWFEIEFKIFLRGGKDLPYFYSIMGVFDTNESVSLGDMIIDQT